MADVQPENGYTRIADEILEQMARVKLSPTQYRILFVVWRFTYGFNRKEHDLSLGFLSQATGCDKRQLQRELKGLEDRKIVFQKVMNGKGRKLMFNKNHDEWTGKSTVGETTIGEIDNGETADGGEDNGTIGEIVKGTIGETDNQDIQKDNLIDIYSATTGAQAETVHEAYTKAFNGTVIPVMIRDYIVKLKSQGCSDQFLIELLLETGESSTKPNLKLLEAIGTRWMTEGIQTRFEARRRRDDRRSRRNGESRQGVARGMGEYDHLSL